MIRQYDKPLNNNAPYFRVRQRFVNLAVGTDELIVPNGDRFALIVSVAIGTSRLPTRIAGSPIDSAGVYVIPTNQQGDTYGILLDDNLPPLHWTVANAGYAVALGWRLRVYFANYSVSITEIDYDPTVGRR